jgi:hypothetical protein
LAAVLLAVGLQSAVAHAQQAPGFSVERLYLSAPGGGWFVMDALDMHGGLGGAAALTLGYSNNPLVVEQGSQRVAVVQNQAFADIGFAATWDRWRFYLNVDTPAVIKGQSGSIGSESFTAPNVDLASHPDTIADPRLGADVRILGGPSSPFRLGASVQLIAPTGVRSDYDSDGTFRAMVRAVIAGDVGQFTYAGQVGVHVRALDMSGTPDAPRGSELLFGVAGGVKLPVRVNGGMAIVLGPELYGASSFHRFFSAADTPFEALLSGRLEGTGSDGMQLRVKLGVGAGINPVLGAPEWRVVVGVETFNHSDR